MTYIDMNIYEVMNFRQEHCQKKHLESETRLTILKLLRQKNVSKKPQAKHIGNPNISDKG